MGETKERQHLVLFMRCLPIGTRLATTPGPGDRCLDSAGCAAKGLN